MRAANPPCACAAVAAKVAADRTKIADMAWRFMMVPSMAASRSGLCRISLTPYFAHSVRLQEGSQMPSGCGDVAMTDNIKLGLLLIAGMVVTLLGQPALAAPIPIGAVASIAEMQGLNGVAAPVVQVLSYYPGLNRGGGLFVWNAASGDAPDGCTAFAPQKQAGQKGRWVRQLSGALDATMCGAYWDNAHDDAAALTRAFAAAAVLRVNLSLPGGTAKVCSSVRAAHAVTVRGQGMSTNGASDPAPTLVNGTCIKSGWVFDITAPAGAGAMEAPKYYDMGIQAGSNSNPGGCIRWNDVAGGF